MLNIFDKDEIVRTLPHDFRKSTYLVNILIIYRNHLLEIAKTYSQIVGLSDIYNCTGVNLDQYGRNFGVRRDGNTDDVYRELILIKLVSLLSSGTIPEILEVTESVLNLTSGEMMMNEIFPGKIQLEVMKPSYISGVFGIVDKIRAAGVGYSTEVALGDSFIMNGSVLFDMDYYNTEISYFNRNREFDDARYQTTQVGDAFVERHSKGAFLTDDDGELANKAIVGTFKAGEVKVGQI